MSRDLLILVDVQRDFLPGGALAVPDGDAVVPVCNALIERAGRVVATQDWHPREHGSFAANHPGKQVGETIELDGVEQVLWPVHCVAGSDGATFAPGLATDRVEAIFRKGTDPRVDSYSGLFDNGRRRSTGLDGYLRGLAPGRVLIAGLATDYCVCFTALDVVELGLPTAVVIDGCRGVELSPGDVDRAVDAMRAAGVEIV